MYLSPLQNALEFTVTTAFNIYISIVVVRFLLQLVRADFHNPVAQFIYKATNPLIIPLNKFLPKLRNIDLSVILLALILQALEIVLLLLIRGYSFPISLNSIAGLLIWGSGELLDIVFVVYLFTTFVLVIFSWFQPGQYNPIVILLAQIAEPIYRRIGKIMPNTGAIDFTPMVMIFILILCRILISDPLIQLGKSIL